MKTYDELEMENRELKLEIRKLRRENKRQIVENSKLHKLGIQNFKVTIHNLNICSPTTSF